MFLIILQQVQDLQDYFAFAPQNSCWFDFGMLIFFEQRCLATWIDSREWHRWLRRPERVPQSEGVAGRGQAVRPEGVAEEGVAAVAEEVAEGRDAEVAAA